MKRLGRRGRVLGMLASEEDMLDDVIQQQLLHAAGITPDVLQDMSDEEKKGTLKAILESNPVLLTKFTKVKLDNSDTDINRPHSVMSSSKRSDPVAVMNQDCSDDDSTQDPGTSCLALKDTRTKLCHESPDHNPLLQPMQISEADIEQTITTAVKEKVSQYVSGSPQAAMTTCVPDSDEDTQRCDMEDWDVLITDTEINMEQKLMPEDTVPETQAFDSFPDSRIEDERHGFKVNQKEEEGVKPGSCDRSSLYFRLQPSLESKQDVSLTRIYRVWFDSDSECVRSPLHAMLHEEGNWAPHLTASRHRNMKVLSLHNLRKQHKQAEMGFWPSMYAAGHVKDPACYTPVIQFILSTYMHQLCRAHKQIDERVEAWGTPVTTGAHVEGCLIAKSRTLADKFVQDEERKGRVKLRSRLQRAKEVQVNMGNRQRTTDRDFDDLDVRTFRHEENNHGRLPDMKTKPQELNTQNTLRLRSSRRLAVVDKKYDTEESGLDDDEVIPTVKKRTKTNRFKTSGDRKQTEVKQDMELEQDCKRKTVNKTGIEYSDINSEKRLVGVIQTREVDKQTQVTAEGDTALKECNVSIQQKYVWSEEESESSSPTIVSYSTRKDIHADTQHETQSPHLHLQLDRIESSEREVKTDTFVIVPHEKYNNERTNVDMTPSDPSECDNSSHSGAAARSISQSEKDMNLAGISSSQSSESLLDVHGNLYSTQVSHTTRIASPSCGQQDQKPVRCPDSNFCTSVDLWPTNRAEVKVLEAENKPSSLLAHLTNERRAELGLLLTDRETHDDIRCDRMEKDNFMKNRSGSKGDDCKAQPKVRSHEESRKRSLVVRTGSGGSNLRDNVKGHVSQKRRRLDFKFEEAASINKNVELEVDLAAGTNRLRDAPTKAGDNTPEDLGQASSFLQPQQQTFEGVMIAESTCPICDRWFHPSKLEAHASTCGEENVQETDQEEQFRCVSCRLEFPQALLRIHQTACLQKDVTSKRVTRSSKE